MSDGACASRWRRGVGSYSCSMPLATRPRPCEVSQTLPAPAYSTFCVPLWNLEDKACCRRMRDQPISCIGDARLRGGDAAAGIEHAALGADDAVRLAHAAHE